MTFLIYDCMLSFGDRGRQNVTTECKSWRTKNADWLGLSRNLSIKTCTYCKIDCMKTLEYAYSVKMIPPVLIELLIGLVYWFALEAKGRQLAWQKPLNSYIYGIMGWSTSCLGFHRLLIYITFKLQNITISCTTIINS